MANELIKACQYLDVDEKSVLSWMLYDDHIALVVDKGIEGCPKYLVKFSELVDKPDPVEVEAAKVDTLKAKYVQPAEKTVSLQDSLTEEKPKKSVRKRRTVKK